MLYRRYLAAAVASVMTITGLIASVPAAARDYLQCVPFARAESGVEIRGNAKTWWSQAAGSYERGAEPRKGAVMAFAGTRGMPMGHVAVVKKVVSDREILIDHANWSPINGRRGQIERDVRVVDVSDAGDWSMVRVWYAPIADLGLRANPVQGFIYANGDAGAPNSAPSFKAPVWAQNDWKPGNDLEMVVASLGN
ncbi:CHAP domain-containing protein [Sphingopyxis sp. JAI128]|uniref:CHAP domain-containing protein n=1 Tax=Sphingopyxis sp. JAI128 TaxID=2723066 RepID=UPI00161D98CD|nr:CHAP domain-containing protein [Sphingopyxis sp. JAI128]MBB6426065.1 surface antigen [Sphingopyxis sp. JAI128]